MANPEAKASQKQVSGAKETFAAKFGEATRAILNSKITRATLIRSAAALITGEAIRRAYPPNTAFGQAVPVDVAGASTGPLTTTEPAAGAGVEDPTAKEKAVVAEQIKGRNFEINNFALGRNFALTMMKEDIDLVDKVCDPDSPGQLAPYIKLSLYPDVASMPKRPDQVKVGPTERFGAFSTPKSPLTAEGTDAGSATSGSFVYQLLRSPEGRQIVQIDIGLSSRAEAIYGSNLFTNDPTTGLSDNPELLAFREGANNQLLSKIFALTRQTGTFDAWPYVINSNGLIEILPPQGRFAQLATPPRVGLSFLG